MEESINQENSFIEQNNELVVTLNMKSHLLKYAKWAKFLGIITWISAILMFIIGIAFLLAGFLGITWPIPGGNQGVFFSVSLFMIIFIYGIVYAVMAKYLMTSAKQTQFSILANDQEALEKGTHNLQKLFSLVGVITIIGLCISALIIIFSIISAALLFPMTY